MKKSLLTRLKTFMLLFSVPNLFIFVLGACQRWQNGVMEETGAEQMSKFPSKPSRVFHFPICSQNNPDYSLLGDNKLPEIRTSLTLKSGWRRQIFPIPR